MDNKIAVIGGGSWGTALSIHLGRKGLQVDLWIYEQDLAEAMQKTRENKRFLPGYPLPDTIFPVTCIEEAVKDKKIVILVTPSHVLGSTVKKILPSLHPDAILVNASKGLEVDTLLPPSKVVERERGDNAAFAALSGPTFAREVAHAIPSTILVASKDPETAEQIKDLFSADSLRVFTSSDLTGVEIGGALKNVIALAAGICDGLELGHNTRAGLITRGLVEISRIGTAMGARPETFYGLSGLGDLVLTCTGDLSRNRAVGIRLGKGEKLADITREMQTVAEGIKTVKAAYALKEKFEIQASIIDETYQVIYESKDPREALKDLMKVEISGEFSGVRGLNEN